MARTKTAEEMTIEDRINLSNKVTRTLRHLLIDQANERLREQGADFEYVIVYKEEEEAKQTTG